MRSLRTRRYIFLLIALASSLVFAGCEFSCQVGGGTDTVTVNKPDVTVPATPPPAETGAGGQAQSCDAFDFNIKVIEVKNMTCEEANAALGQIGQVSKSFQLGEFSCNLVEGRRISGIWECTSGRKSFKFAFGD